MHNGTHCQAKTNTIWEYFLREAKLRLLDVKTLPGADASKACRKVACKRWRCEGWPARIRESQ